MVFHFVACGDDASDPIGVKDEIPTGPTQADRIESSQISLWLSQEYVAPSDLTEVILKDLYYIRKEYGKELPQATLGPGPLRFLMPFVPSKIIILISQETSNLLDSGEWKVFETLCTSFGLEELRRGAYGEYVGIQMKFEGDKNSVLIAETYAELEGILAVGLDLRWCWLAGVGCGCSWLYPQTTEDGRSYLYVEPTAAPSPGMSGGKYWYFRSSDTGIDLVGFWDRRQGGAWPDWWVEATQVIDETRDFYERWSDFEP
jgi:hypothetical protein